MSSLGESSILQIGYQVYEGPRLGAQHAFFTVVKSTLRYMFGVARPFRYRVLPVLLLLSGVLPAIVLVAVDVAVLRRSSEQEVGTYYEVLRLPLLLFAAFIGSDVLAYDKRTRKLDLYLASPITEHSYVAAKAVALGLSLVAMALIPTSVILAADLATGGFEGLGPGLLDGVRLALSAGVVATAYTLTAMAAGSLTERGGVAAAIAILGYLGLSVLASGLTESGSVPGDILLIDVATVPVESAFRIHGAGRNGLWSSVSDVSLWSALILSGCLAGMCVWFGMRSARTSR